MAVKVSLLEVDEDQGFVNVTTLKDNLEKTCCDLHNAGYAIVSVVPIISCIWGGFPMSSADGPPASEAHHGLADVPYNYTSAVMVVSQK